ncbi:MAG: guanylate kinase [Opitutales bacterium]
MTETDTTAPVSGGLLLIVSGPAGSGKTTVCDAMLKAHGDSAPPLRRVITSTTRRPRPGEVHGRDYYFFDDEAFEKKVRAGDFYEHALVHGRGYGTLKQEVQDKLAASIDLILNIDVQGAAAFRRAAETDPALKGRVVTVFIMPPNLDALRERLAARGERDADEVERRLESARKEMAEAPRYDAIIESGSKEADFKALDRIYREARARLDGSA